MVLKPLDSIMIIITLGIITFYFFNTVSSNNNSSFVKVEVEGKAYLYPLEKDQSHTFIGPIGETTIMIKNKKASIIESDCHNKTCISIGEISKNGQSSACLPNRVIISIEGDDNGEVDVVTY